MRTQQTKHILVIEDDEMFRILAQDAFWIHGAEGYCTDLVMKRSLIEAERYLGNGAIVPDIILLEPCLSPLDGTKIVGQMLSTFEFIASLKRDERYTRTCIIVYSRFDENELKEKAYEAGANHYLVKGELTPKELVNFVEKI